MRGNVKVHKKHLGYKSNSGIHGIVMLSAFAMNLIWHLIYIKYLYLYLFIYNIKSRNYGQGDAMQDIDNFILSDFWTLHQWQIHKLVEFHNSFVWKSKSHRYINRLKKLFENSLLKICTFSLTRRVEISF